MNQYAWDTRPEPVRQQVEQVCAALRALLKENLVGIYLHGSLATGCFNPDRSDLDLLVVTERPMAPETKRRIVELLLGTSGNPTPIELSVLAHEHLHPWRYPPPFDLHFSEEWRQRYREDLSTGAGRRWDQEPRTDVDLAAHITHLLDRGIRLEGAPIGDVFPAVPREGYVAAILADYKDARAGILHNPVYGVLNMVRVCRYLQDGRLSSKDEAGAWATQALPQEDAFVVESALAQYRGDPVDGDIVPDDLEHFIRVLDERICPHLPKRDNVAGAG